MYINATLIHARKMYEFKCSLEQELLILFLSTMKLELYLLYLLSCKFGGIVSGQTQNRVFEDNHTSWFGHNKVFDMIPIKHKNIKIQQQIFT